MSGIIGLNDLAITNAMKSYFNVDKRDMLPLSLSVRSFYNKVLAIIKEKDGDSGS